MPRTAIGLPLVIGIFLSACGATAHDRQQAAPEPSEAQLATVEQDEDVFPRAFRGKWARDRATCNDPDGKGLEWVTAKRMTGYQTDAVLLKAALEYEAAPDKQQAYTLTALVAESGEGEMGVARYRLSLSRGRLYVSGGLHVSGDVARASQHWGYPLIRCPA